MVTTSADADTNSSHCQWAAAAAAADVAASSLIIILFTVFSVDATHTHCNPLTRSPLQSPVMLFLLFDSLTLPLSLSLADTNILIWMKHCWHTNPRCYWIIPSRWW